MARDLYDDHFKAVESMPRGVVVTLRNIATQLESSWELHTNRQVRQALLLSDFFKICVCVFCLLISVCAPHVCLVPTVARRHQSDPLDLPLQIVVSVSHHVGTGSCTWIFCKSKRCCYPPSLSSPCFLFYFKLQISC